MPLYILDAVSLIELDRHANAKGMTFATAISRMTNLATAGELIFPPLVVRDCKDFGETDFITSWVRATASGFSHNPGYQYTEQVLDACDEVLDPDDPNESADVEVLALALERLDDGHPVELVTAQWVDLPSRICLGNAAGRIGIPCISTSDFVARL